jgi:hypothetical protein
VVGILGVDGDARLVLGFDAGVLIAEHVRAQGYELKYLGGMFLYC